MKNYFYNLGLLSLIVFPISLATGTFLPNLIVVNLTFLSIYFYLTDRDFKIYISEIIHLNFIKIFIIFYILIVISSLTSDLFLNSIGSSIFYFRYIFFVIIGSYLLKSKTKFIRYAFMSIIITFLYIFIHSVIEILFGISILSGNYDEYRLELFQDEAVTGTFISRLMPMFILSLFITLRKFKYKDLIIILSIVICGFFVLKSGERTAYFYFLIFFFLIILSRLFNNKLKIMSILLLIVLSTAVLLISDKTRDRMINDTILQIFDENKNFQGFSEQHNSHYQTSLKIFYDHKLIGAGPKAFRYLCNQEKYKINDLSCSTHPHNTYFQLLAESGILGFLIIFMIFLFLIKKIFSIIVFEKNKDKQLLELCIFTCFLISLWPLSPSNNFFGSWYNNIYFFPLIFYFLNKSNPIWLLKNDK